MLRESFENLGRSRSAEKHTRIVLMMEGLEGPDTQDKAERFMAATGHHLEDVVATCRTTGIAGEVAGKIVQHPVGLPTALEEIRCGISPARPQQRWTVSQRQLATTFEDTMAKFHPPGIAEEVAGTSSNTQCAFRQLREKYGVKRRRHDLSSVFMTVDDPDTPWHPQLFSAVSFEPQRLTEDGATVRTSSVLPSSSHFESQFWVEKNIRGVPGQSPVLPLRDFCHGCPLLQQRNTCALCWDGKPLRVRTLKTKLGVSWRRLACVNVATLSHISTRCGSQFFSS